MPIMGRIKDIFKIYNRVGKIFYYSPRGTRAALAAKFLTRPCALKKPPDIK